MLDISDGIGAYRTDGNRGSCSPRPAGLPDLPGKGCKYRVFGFVMPGVDERNAPHGILETME
jgi:hypothetical protein